MNLNHFLKIIACFHFELGLIDLSRESFHVSLIMNYVVCVVQTELVVYVRFLQGPLHDLLCHRIFHTNSTSFLEACFVRFCLEIYYQESPNHFRFQHFL